MYETDRQTCVCENCQSGKYDPRDFMLYEEDFKRLDQERPLGISGHLRVKNEALSVGQCIESCIDFLDELIITYNDSEDGTEEILQEYAIKYPNKIRLYHYKPYVTPHTYFERYIDLAKTKAFPDDDSIHNPANYYNYGYTKVKYRYYLKIDADQIYFTKKLLDIKKIIYDEWSHKISKYPFHVLFEKIRNKITRKMENIGFIKKNRNISSNRGLILGGINLFGYESELVVPIEVTKEWKYNFFNGLLGDTVIFIPTSSSYYYVNQEHLYETIDLPSPCASIGLCWVHLGYVKNRVAVTEDVLKTCSLLELSKMTWKELHTPLLDNALAPNNEWVHSQYVVAGEEFWDRDIQYITQEFYDHYFPNILEYYRNNIMPKKS